MNKKNQQVSPIPEQRKLVDKAVSVGQNTPKYISLFPILDKEQKELSTIQKPVLKAAIENNE